MLDKYEIIRLNKTTDEFFPKDGKWSCICFDVERRKEHSMIFLPSHLHDSDWLVAMFNERIPNFPKEVIEIYINTNPYFEKKRDKYEQEIVKWQIRYMLNGGDGWICDDEFYMFNPDCDKVFRDGIFKTLTAINMDEERVEEGIEKNRDLWLEKWIKTAFNNIYDSFWDFFSIDDLPKVSEDHFNMWRRLRIYEYYNDHKNFVDKYGKVLDGMIMKDEEVEELKKKLDIEDFKRHKVIEEFHKNHPRDSFVSSISSEEYNDSTLFTEVLELPKEKIKK